LYQKGGPWPAPVNRLLTVFRSLVAAILCFLLIGPIIKLVLTETEKPVLVFAIDNSLSIAQTEDSVLLSQVSDELLALENPLANDYEIAYRNLSGPVEQLDGTYKNPSTDLNNLLRTIEQDYEGRNLAKVVLVTDGIYNQGISPAYRDYSYEIVSLGLGDTIPKMDLKISGVYYNKIAYQGNRFPLVVEVLNQGFIGQLTTLSLLKGGQVLDSKSISFDKDNQLNEVEFLVDANEEGLQRYSLALSVLEGEYLEENNYRQIFVDIVEGKENILVAASAPHPDVKAVISAIETNPNYEVTKYIHGIDTFEPDKYDLAIFIRMPDRSRIDQAVFERIAASTNSHLFLLGTNTNVNKINTVTDILNVSRRGYQTDQVTAAFNPGFSTFLVSDELREQIADFPPVTVPFGQYAPKPGASILMSQIVGNIDTGRPLILVDDEGDKKTGMITGEGIWRWKLFEYRDTRKTKNFDELIVKLVQYLSSKEDKRKFRVFTTQEQYSSAEPVRFQTEIYNDLYESVFGNEIELTVESADGESQNFSYVNGPSRNGYTLSGLDEGIYSFTASTLISGQRTTSKGQFVVQAQTIEMLNLTADHNLLRTLANSSGGAFFHKSQLAEMGTALSSQKSAALLRSSESYRSVINLPLVFFLLLSMVTIEWLLRKYYGSY